MNKFLWSDSRTKCIDDAFYQGWQSTVFPRWLCMTPADGHLMNADFRSGKKKLRTSLSEITLATGRGTSAT